MIDGVAKTRKHTIDPVELFINACSFHAASIALDRQPDKNLLFWPMVVNEAFALELFVKCLHLVRGRTVTGHDVRSLFNRLPQEDRDSIATYYHEAVNQHPLYQQFVALGVPFDIDSVLRRSNDAFTRIRYWHEKQMPNPDSSGKVSNAGTGNLSDAIKRRILESEPKWSALGIRVPVRFDNRQPPP